MTRPEFAKRLRAGEPVKGTFLNLGSALTAEIAGQAGFDWLMLDLEHGSGDYAQLIHQLQALAAYPVAALVRVAWNEPWMIKRVLDAGAHGVMVPCVENAEQARAVVNAMRYPPEGVRGVAGYNRACQFGPGFDAHYARASQELVKIVQIETVQAVENVEEIAAVDGVDLLFIGPADLSASYGIIKQLNHPDYRQAVARTIAAARRHGKQVGTLVLEPDQAGPALADGFTFVGIGSDSSAVVKGLRGWSEQFDRIRAGD